MLKVGGKAKHPTLGHVTILVLGPLGAKIEFFSNAPGETNLNLLSDIMNYLP